MKIFKRYITLLVLPVLILLGAMSSCKKHDEPYLGNTVKAASANFVASDFCAVKVGTSPTTCPPVVTNAAFGAGGTSAEKYYFHCTFNEDVTWTITITGRNSGAIKTMTGTSLGLDFGNTATIWNGNASGYRFFQRGETCDIVISFLGTTQTLSTTLTMRSTVIGALRYENFSNVAVLDNFDGTATAGPISFPYVDLGDDGMNSIYQARETGSVKPIDGIFMLRMMGTDVNGNTYLGGTGPELLTTNAAAIQKIVPLCETDASKLYFNLYIYGTGKANSNVQIRTYELDTINACVDKITNPYPIQYNIAAQANNDQWASDIYITWTGWKLVSIPYSSFKPSNNPAAGGNGNRVKEPRKVTGINLLLQSMPNANATVDMYIDYITVTWGTPFVQ